MANDSSGSIVSDENGVETDGGVVSNSDEVWFGGEDNRRDRLD